MRQHEDSVGFNSRVREGRDSTALDYNRSTKGFNSRVREGRDIINGIKVSRFTFQLTRPRGTRPDKASMYYTLTDVSTHASARDATHQRSARRGSA